MNRPCPQRSREHARKVSEGGRIAKDASTRKNAAGWARVKGEAVGELAVPVDGQSVGSGEQCNIAPDTATSGGYRLAGGGGTCTPCRRHRLSFPLAAGPGWPRRVKEQVIRTRRAHADTNPTCVLAGAPLLLGVLRQGARQSGCYEPRRIAADLQVGWQAGLPGRHRFPVRAVFSHRCGCPMAGIHIEFFST
jgi:hypothetical protein